MKSVFNPLTVAGFDKISEATDFYTELDSRYTLGTTTTTISNTLNSHISDTANPHSVTKTHVGLSNVVNSLQLVASNNLSDIVNAATARTNLGLVSGGAGDIWVEKTGDTMSGTLLFSQTSPRIDFYATVPGQFYIERSDTTMTLKSTGVFAVDGGTRCQLASNTDVLFNIGSNVKFYVNSSGQSNLNANSTTTFAQFDIYSSARSQIRLSYDFNVNYTELRTSSAGYLLIAPSKNRVAIGTTSSSPTAKLHIIGNEDLVQFRVQGHSTQTTNLIEHTNSAGTKLYQMNAAGEVGVGSGNPLTNRMFNTGKTFTTAAASENHRAFYYQGLVTSNHASTSNVGFEFDVRQTAGTTGALDLIGVKGVAINQSTTVVGNVQGGQFAASVTGGGGSSNLHGLNVRATAAGAVSTSPRGVYITAQRSATVAGVAQGVTAGIEALSGGTISDGYTFYARSATKSADVGTVFTRSYGLYVEAQTAADTNYAIYTNAGDIRLMASATDKLGFYGVTPVIQQTGGVATAGASYTATEQDMLQKVYNALRSYGLLS